MTKQREAVNLMELKPRWVAEWEESAQGVVVHAPRGRLLTFIARRLGRPDCVRLQLDELGAFVWLRCDGSRRVYEIIEEIERSREDEPQSMVPRVAAFLNRLAREKLITYEGSR